MSFWFYAQFQGISLHNVNCHKVMKVEVMRRKKQSSYIKIMNEFTIVYFQLNHEGPWIVVTMSNYVV